MRKRAGGNCRGPPPARVAAHIVHVRGLRPGSPDRTGPDRPPARSRPGAPPSALLGSPCDPVARPDRPPARSRPRGISGRDRSPGVPAGGRPHAPGKATATTGLGPVVAVGVLGEWAQNARPAVPWEEGTKGLPRLRPAGRRGRSQVVRQILSSSSAKPLGKPMRPTAGVGIGWRRRGPGRRPAVRDGRHEHASAHRCAVTCV